MKLSGILFRRGADTLRAGSKAARLLAAAALTLGAAGLAPVAVADDPDHIAFTLEGCRNTGDVVFGATGPFICELTSPTATGGSYTTGNLGKGWAELDLVPHRVTAGAGNAAPASQTYTIAVVVDNEDGSTPGYDFLSVPVLNTALSDAGCAIPVVGNQLVADPGLGGISKSLYRLVTITQAKNTECVYDFYARLALGSTHFAGASLHANLALEDDPITTSGIGAKEVSIPDIDSPQTLAKTMTATQNSSVRWGISKSANPTSLSFGDVCAPSAPTSKDVAITVNWTRDAVDPEQITGETRISANNPASRPLYVVVSDEILNGATSLDTASLGQVLLGAKSALALVGTHQFSFAPSTLTPTVALNDIATATYIDPVAGLPEIVGTATATANATVQPGTVTNGQVAISDSEDITGNGLSYSADSFSGAAGAFQGYTAGTETTGAVDWLSALQSNSGSVTFAKKVYLDGKRITSGVLSDVAKVNAGDTVLASTNVLEVPISSSATVALTLIKTIPDILDAGESLEVSFEITRTDDPTFKLDKTLTFAGGGATTQQTVIDGLVPDDYSVEETKVVFFDGQGGETEIFGLAPGENPVAVGLDLPTCSGTARFDNELNVEEAVRAKVQKITEPELAEGDSDLTWEFTLTGPDALEEIVSANANAGYVNFESVLTTEGDYTVTETLKSPTWDLTAVNGDATKTTCTFTVDFPEDLGKTQSCTFKNVKRGLVEVEKTLSGGPLTGTTAAFTFELRKDASASASGTVLETEVASASNNGSIAFEELLIPGNHYQLCESVLAGWQSTLTGFVPGFSPPDSTIDNSIVCVDFTVDAGETKVFAVDNTPPPGGHALTIGYWKNHASCKLSNGKQDPVLDQTLYSAPGHSITIGLLTLSAASSEDAGLGCANARALLDKRDIVTGKKMASDPLFNLAAQLVAVKLNLIAGAATCSALNTAVTQADALLVLKGFNGTGKKNLTAAQAALANQLAQTLDSYNNNTLCP